MTDFIIKKLPYDLSSHAGLALVGKYLKRININALIDPAFPVRSGVANSAILKSYMGLLCLGKNDFDAIENFRSNAFFMRALGLASVPSSPTLRQRLDIHAASWFDLAAQLNHKLLASTVNGKAIDFGALACGYTPVDLDTFAMDNSSTKKELVGRTYAGVDGYCPLAAYLGSHGFCLEMAFDYLFVDEAGQVSLANSLALSTCTKNLVLLGDQMQLGQPTQGVHPGESGLSTLEYLLQGASTIAPEAGIFLKDTWRMHPDVCRFISDAVYDGRLQAEAKNTNQRLVLTTKAAEGSPPALKSNGVQFIEVQRSACAQRSDVEAEIVRNLVDTLLKQQYADREGVLHPVTLDNILVVAPYNQQVNLLMRVLPESARVGTVDKFQGQEAEVVLVSMTTSSGEFLPRDIEFLYSKNRLNVAISRARALAIVITSPMLLEISCHTPEQMALVNTLCWVPEYAWKKNR